jgi:hypothetical protein
MAKKTIKQLEREREKLEEEIEQLKNKEEKTQQDTVNSTFKKWLASMPENHKTILEYLFDEQCWTLKDIKEFYNNHIKGTNHRFFINCYWGSDGQQSMGNIEDILDLATDKLYSSYDESFDVTIFDAQTDTVYYGFRDLVEIEVKIT